MSRAHCGHSFVICLGNNIRKEIPSIELVQGSATKQPPVVEMRKKKVIKRKKNGEKKRSTVRPHTSSNLSKFTADHTQNLLPV